MKVLLATHDVESSYRVVFPDLEVYDWAEGHEFPRWSGDLLIFTGGEDINPAIYGQSPNGTYVWNNERDERERNIWRLYRNSIITAKKVLGVCRGHQLLNVMLGGTLFQDLHMIGKSHRGDHPIKWELPIINELGSMEYVNSLHHQAIATVGSRYNYRILAIEPRTRIIESVLWSDTVLGVQFHPEWLGSFLREQFFTAIEKWVKGEPLVKGEQLKEKKQNDSYDTFTFRSDMNPELFRIDPNAFISGEWSINNGPFRVEVEASSVEPPEPEFNDNEQEEDWP